MSDRRRCGVLTEREAAAVSAHVVRSPYNQPCTSLQCHFVPNPHTQGACVFSCNLHIWQNEQDLLRATAVTWGWN